MKTQIKYFSLKKRPFTAEPVPEAFCAFGSTERARLQISRGIERQEGVALVSGRVGTGKTLLCRTLQKQFRDVMETVILNGENLKNPKSLFQTIFSAFNIPCDPQDLTEMRVTMVRLLQSPSTFRNGLLLLIDDAQAAGLRVFEELRQLLDCTFAPGNGVRVVLFGNTSLEEKLAFPQMNSFSQRITIRCFLETMNRDETTAFLNQELKAAGDEKKLFSKDVCREIHRFTDGVPRAVNQLADQVLVMAGEEAEKKVEKEDSALETTVEVEITPVLVQKAWARIQQLPEADSSSAHELNTAPISDSGSGSAADSGVLAAIDAPVSQKMNKNGSDSKNGSIEFGELDDDFDDEHTIEFGSEINSETNSGNNDTPTGIWTYNEAEEIRDAVENANAIPEEWNASLRENSADAVSAGTVKKAVPEVNTNSIQNSTVNSNAGKTSSPTHSASESVSQQTDTAVKTASSFSSVSPDEDFRGSETAANSSENDLWDVFKENANIHFPGKKESAWIPPSYSASSSMNFRPGEGNYNVSASSSQSFVQPQSFASPSGYTPVSGYAPFQSPQQISAASSKGSVLPFRPRTVDEIIYDSVLDDTLHSMTLLNNVLKALSDEMHSGRRMNAPSEYWMELHDIAKDSIHRIATERMRRTPQPVSDSGSVSGLSQTPDIRSTQIPPQKAPVSSPVSQVPPHQERYFSSGNEFISEIQKSVPISDSNRPAQRPPMEDYYRPETLIEEGSYPQERGRTYRSAGRPDVSNRFEAVKETENRGTGTAVAETPGQIQDIVLLRQMLQECRSRGSIDSDTQERCMRIITQLKTIGEN